MIRAVSVLGSTGSIGIQTLEVAEHFGIKVVALSANKNVEALYHQVLHFRPSLVSMADEQSALELKRLIGDEIQGIEVMTGESGNLAVASAPQAEMVVAAMVGVAGLLPVLEGIRAGKDIALANKETLVAGGEFVMKAAAEAGVCIYPVDSEHSAVWQCLPDHYAGIIRRILLTASGGPFRGRTRDSLQNVTVKDALAHPTWSMGPKITIDSATLMNKGLEVIEAHWLFDVPAEKIQVVVHPQSIIHSMVEFTDGSVLSQMGFPDMKLPIQIALMKKKRNNGVFKEFDPFTAGSLTFEKPDIGTFRCLGLAYEALSYGGSMPAVMNSANEKAVELFLDGHIGFLEIPVYISATMEEHYKDGIIRNLDYGGVVALDRWARAFCSKI
ncbi:MAG: 1-deoxy-D-xylulose-5-phosphate reductoisomerase [Saccharofermentanales bacterium]